MAQESRPSRRTAADERPDGDGAPEKPAEPRLPVLRFGLRQLFWALTAVCLVVASVVAAPKPGIAPLVVLVAVSAVVFHVIGTAIGSRLRAHADERIAWQAAHGLTAEPRGGLPIPKTRPSSWHQRGLQTRWRWWLVGGGALVGGLVGGLIFAFVETLSHRPVEIAFGALSLAVVGGWLAFLGHGFWVNLRRGWREAVDEQRKDGPRVSRRP